MKEFLKKSSVFFGAFLLSMLFLGTGERVLTAKAENVSLVQGEAVRYMGYSTHYYYVNGNMAYCLEPDMNPPSDGSYPSDILDKNQLLSKAMYYVYGGPGFEEYMKPSLTGGWDEKDRSYCLSHCILSYIYDGCDSNSAGFIGLNEDIKNAVIQFTGAIRSWPEIPDTDIGFSDTDIQTYFSPEEKRQRTKEVSCAGDPRNTITISLPDGVTLVNVSKGQEMTGRGTVSGQEQFYLAADVTFGNGETWNSGELYGSIRESWRTLVIKTGGGSQDIGTGQVVSAVLKPVSLQVKWMEKPELNVDKSADKEDKKYKVGDLITYTMEITQRLQNAVAKNVVISDTILTEGVKLQKKSIVLLDENHSVVSDAQINVKGNTYTIQAGQSLEFLQCVESGERFFVEYQVMITDKSVIGKEIEIENEVVVRADNAEEKKDKEIVTVEEEPEPEEPEEKPKEEPKEEPEPQPEKVEKVSVVQVPEREAVKTGDENNLMVITLLLILSCAAIFMCVRISRKTK